MFIIGAIVSDGDIVNCIIFRGVSITLHLTCTVCKYCRRDKIINTSQYNIVQNNTTSNLTLTEFMVQLSQFTIKQVYPIKWSLSAYYKHLIT